MNNLQQRETVALIQCSACGAAAVAKANFCRSCGSFLQAVDGGSATMPGRMRESYETTRLEPVASPRAGYESVSGPLVRAVLAGVAEGQPGRNRLLNRVAAVLVAIPLWLMIVVLSPLDAYLATRSLSRSINVHSNHEQTCRS